MTPQDASALLLVLMYDQELAIAEQSAASLCDARLVQCRHMVFGESDFRFGDFPRNAFFGVEAAPLRFGEVIATILDWYVRYGTLEEGDDTDLDLYVANLIVTVSSPGYLGKVHFNTHEGAWQLTYEWKPPEQIAYETELASDPLATTWEARKGPRMCSSRTVGEDSLHLVADCLRACEWDDAWEEFTPPYDQTKAPREFEGA